MEEPRTTLRRRSSALPIVLLVVAALGVIAFFARRFWQRAPTPEPPAVLAPGTAPPLDPPVPQDEKVDPATAESLLAGASSHPLWRRALAEGGLVERVALVADNLREGVSPRKPLAFLAPEKPFSVVRRGETLVVDPASYARYDAFGDAVASVDAEGLARAFRAIRGPVEAAYRALGYPGGGIERAISRGLARIESVPVLDGDVALQDEEGVYAFADEKLERLREVEKHVLRMGPRNVRLLQAKARELRAALALPDPAAAGSRSP
jgi:hypothetical protein